MKIIKIISYNTLFFSLIIFFLELTFSFFVDDQIYQKCINCYGNEPDKSLGWWNKKNYTHLGVKHCSNKICYRAKYSYDAFGRRVTRNQKSNNRHVILLGGSYTFGEGLNSEETLAFKLQNKIKEKVYNYGVPGGGVPHALTLLLDGRIRKEVSEKKGVAIYIATRLHPYRGTFLSSKPWSFRSPYYKTDVKDNIFRSNNIKLSFPTLITLFSWYNKIKEHSSVLSFFDWNYYHGTKLYLNKLMALSLLKAKREYKKEFNGEFYILIHPKDPIDKKVFIEHGLKVLEYSSYNLLKSESSICSCDPHPNGRVNQFIAKELSKEAFLNTDDF